MALSKLKTVTNWLLEPTQPPASDPFTEYVVVTVGVAVTLAPLVADKPVAGVQV